MKDEHVARPAAGHRAILGAALALPGVAGLAGAAYAEGAPADGVIAFKYLSYSDSQPSLDRIKVTSPSVYALLPLGASWSIEGSLVSDSVSGATPRWHTSVSSASKMTDTRHAGDVKITRYFRRSAFGVGGAYSTENDYKSKSVNADYRVSTEDNNTTFAFGLAFTKDDINSTGGAYTGKKKDVVEGLFGVTQVLSSDDIVRVNFTHSRGEGFFTDPYKLVDIRPETRNITTVLGQWNHYVGYVGASARTSYRYYQDTFKVKAHTVGFEWAQPLGPTWIITPAARYYTQSAASFYYDPVYDTTLGAPFPPGFSANPNGPYSSDYRLSAYGGITLGIKVSVLLMQRLTLDAKYETYEQRGRWRLGGPGSTGLEPFRADFFQVGAAWRF